MSLMAARLGKRNVVLFRMASKGDVEFLAHNRVDAVDVAELFKVERAEHVSVVGQRERGHVKALGLGDQLVQSGARVQKRIV